MLHKALTSKGRLRAAQSLRVQGLRGATLPVAHITRPPLAALLVLSLFRFIIPAIDAASRRSH